MHSFAQNCEDVVVQLIFERLQLERPTYLDLGAYHPTDLSNTALLYEKGWRGINVEADPDFMAAFYEQRSEDVNVCAAVGVKSGKAKFYTDKNSLLSFYDQPSIEVDVMAVNEIVDKYAKGVFPDFMTMDLEGMDLTVIESIDYSKSKPKVICVEVGCDISGKYIDTSAQVREFLMKRGYFPFFRVDNNLFLVEAFYVPRLW